MTDGRFDELVEPLRAGRQEACDEYLRELAQARTDGEAVLPWQALARSWALLDPEGQAALKRHATMLLSRPDVSDGDRKLAAVRGLSG